MKKKTLGLITAMLAVALGLGGCGKQEKSWEREPDADNYIEMAYDELRKDNFEEAVGYFEEALEEEERVIAAYTGILRTRYSEQVQLGKKMEPMEYNPVYEEYSGYMEEALEFTGEVDYEAQFADTYVIEFTPQMKETVTAATEVIEEIADSDEGMSKADRRDALSFMETAMQVSATDVESLEEIIDCANEVFEENSEEAKIVFTFSMSTIDALMETGLYANAFEAFGAIVQGFTYWDEVQVMYSYVSDNQERWTNLGTMAEVGESYYKQILNEADELIDYYAFEEGLDKGHGPDTYDTVYEKYELVYTETEAVYVKDREPWALILAGEAAHRMMKMELLEYVSISDNRGENAVDSVNSLLEQPYELLSLPRALQEEPEKESNTLCGVIHLEGIEAEEDGIEMFASVNFGMGEGPLENLWKTMDRNLYMEYVKTGDGIVKRYSPKAYASSNETDYVEGELPEGWLDILTGLHAAAAPAARAYKITDVDVVGEKSETEYGGCPTLGQAMTYIESVFGDGIRITYDGVEYDFIPDYDYTEKEIAIYYESVFDLAAVCAYSYPSNPFTGEEFRYAAQYRLLVYGELVPVE